MLKSNHIKILLLLLVFTLTSFTTETKVFICGPRGAKKYHYSEDCRGLGNCKHQITKVTLSEAKGYGLDLCGWED
jgi:hypothetical protein